MQVVDTEQEVSEKASRKIVGNAGKTVRNLD
jgi:hypothetical protein